jgi:hypothetical protein
LGGSAKKTNLVLLTAKEHFICHLLLTKMVDGKDRYRMACALNSMTWSVDGRIISSAQFSMARKLFAIENSNAKKGKKRKPFTDETRAKMSAARLGKKDGPHSQEHKDKIAESNRGRNKTYSFVNPHGEVVTTNNITELCEKYDLGIKAMYGLANGSLRSTTYKGWKHHTHGW